MSNGIDLNSPARRRVLIVGAGFHNQGAYMMLVAAARFVRDNLGAQPVVEVQFGNARQKRWLGLDTLLAIQKLRFKPWGLSRGRLDGAKGMLPFLMGSDIDAVLDASGFSYSDQWRHVPIDRQAGELERWHMKGVPVYILPQALGPFEHTAAVMKTVLGASRLVFARDQESFRHVSQLVSDKERDRLGQSPDFTIGLSPTVPANSSELERFFGGLAIVPNWNLVSRGPSGGSARAYLQSLVGAVEAARHLDVPVYGLGHEGGRDLDILYRLRGEVGRLDIVKGLNGLESKWLLAKSSGLVGGRFHALVSAMSMGTPSILHGWSHKYEWLARDFGVTEGVLDPYVGKSTTFERVLGLFEHRSSGSAELDKAKAELTLGVDEMWGQVAEDLSLVWAG